MSPSGDTAPRGRRLSSAASRAAGALGRSEASPARHGGELFVVGAAFLLAGLFGRAGRGIGLPTIPFFIVAGIAFGPHTPGPVLFERPDEIYLLAVLGLVLLLFHLGIEFSINGLLAGGWRLIWAGGSYIGLNFGAGLALGWWLD